MSPRVGYSLGEGLNTVLGNAEILLVCAFPQIRIRGGERHRGFVTVEFEENCQSSEIYIIT